MSRFTRLTLVSILLLASMPVLPAMAATGTVTCGKGQYKGADYLVCTPEAWKDLVVYAHGYVDPNLPVGIPEDQLRLPDGTSITQTVTSLGFAFATTSYITNGLAVRQGVTDLLDLVTVFISDTHRTPSHIYLVGASEGGLVTALAVEQHPEVFSGGLATCGPVGDFTAQINYWGDFRVVFDYFFPGVLPLWAPDPARVKIPQEVMANWSPTLTLSIANAVVSNPYSTTQLLNVTHASIDPSNGATITQTVLGLLWYSAFATNDGMNKLGGQPFDNTPRFYFGSAKSWLLNSKVQRFDASPAALAEIGKYYQTSGRLRSPLVTLHTTGDPIVPYWHEPLYRAKVWSSGSALMYSNIPILRYGHCNFKASEVLVGFALLVLKVTGKELVEAYRALPSANAQAEFLQLARQHGALH